MAAMKGVAYDPIAGRLIEVDGPVPEPGAMDLLVEVHAVSANPVDLKMRGRIAQDGPPVIFGYDACGTVLSVGAEVAGFAKGDRVYYAGSATRPGCDATHHAVDARLAAHAPKTLSDAEAAALPLTAITAWEALFERLRLAPLAEAQSERLLIVNGAGGVGSVALQLAKLSGLAAVATASRPESRDWCARMGAADVIGHDALADLPDASVDRIFCCHDMDRYFAESGRLIAPQGMICGITAMPEPQSLMPLFAKSATYVYEYMFTRSMFGTPDMGRQGEILAEVARLVDAGQMQTTLTRTLQGLSVETFEAAYEALSAGRMLGKLAIRF